LYAVNYIVVNYLPFAQGILIAV